MNIKSLTPLLFPSIFSSILPSIGYNMNYAKGPLPFVKNLELVYLSITTFNITKFA
jgi:hypothetical protein